MNLCILPSFGMVHTTQHETQAGLLTEGNAFPEDELEPKHQGRAPVTQVFYFVSSCIHPIPTDGSFSLTHVDLPLTLMGNTCT